MPEYDGERRDRQQRRRQRNDPYGDSVLRRSDKRALRIFHALLIGTALVASMSWSAQSDSQAFTDPSGKTQPGTGVGQETYSGGQPMAVPPALPGVPPVLPGLYSQQPPPGLPHAPGAVPSPGQFAPPPNAGPVTGYGPGGMAPIPGAPINPPYYGPR